MPLFGVTIFTAKREYMARNHVVISGTGRAGTTFLVELLTHLGLDTGYSLEDLTFQKNKIARAGLEHDIRKEGSPYVVKNPEFCDYAEEVLKREDIVIEHVFVPMRDLYAAAESRRFVQESAASEWSLLKRIRMMRKKKPKVRGGLAGTKKRGEQELILLNRIYGLLLAFSNTTVPVTFLHFPRLVEDASYLFEKLKPILGDIEFDRFQAVFEKTAHPELVHSFSKNR